MKLDAWVILIAIVVAALMLTAAVLAPDETPLPAMADDMELVFWLAWTIAAFPLAYAMPSLQASFFGRMWGVPYHTYLMPRWMIRLCIAMMSGQVVALFALAVVCNHRLFWLAGSMLLVGGVFCAGAWRRLKKPPCTEFVMRLWPRLFYRL
ncbi:MAG: hypothetical protein U1E05_09480 [Patescibacteria group bacterium]|nr:hypothetical protein [Patescibacteria group bacterium]